VGKDIFTKDTTSIEQFAHPLLFPHLRIPPKFFIKCWNYYQQFPYNTSCIQQNVWNIILKK